MTLVLYFTNTITRQAQFFYNYLNLFSIVANLISVIHIDFLDQRNMRYNFSQLNLGNFFWITATNMLGYSTIKLESFLDVFSHFNAVLAKAYIPLWGLQHPPPPADSLNSILTK